MAQVHVHRRSSSKWVPPAAPLTIFPGRSALHRGSRVIEPNHLFDAPRYELSNFRNYSDNAISTTKYSLLTFIPLNIWHQISTKYANLYFILIAILNWFPMFNANTKYLGLIPICFVLGTTLIKDGVEDYRRWKFDKKINSRTCHVWDRERNCFRKTEWRYVLVGDFVHISNDQDVPADIVFLRSSDERGTCFVETSNLDGETSLKQRSVPSKSVGFSAENSDFKPSNFNGILTCEKPDKSIYTIRAKIEYEPGVTDVIFKENMLLRGSKVKNTTFVEGVVLYAGHDTKVMMNNGRAPQKTSSIEKLTNKFVIICFLFLIGMVSLGSVASGFWVADHSDTTIPFIVWNIPAPIAEGFINVGAFFINYQTLVPISLYITVEIIKGLQIYFMSQDLLLYDEATDRAVDCRSLNIPEELGTVTHILSDKTGTLTENVMIFRNCAFDEKDYGADVPKDKLNPDKPVRSEELFEASNSNSRSWVMKHFFYNILVNNSVVVNKHPHQDAIELGTFEGGAYHIGNSSFFDVNEEKYKEIIQAAKGFPPARPARLTFAARTELSVIQEASTSPVDTSPSSVIHESRDFSPAETPTSPASRTLSSVSSFSKKLQSVVRRSILKPISDIMPTRSRTISFHQQDFLPYEAESPDELALIEGVGLYNYVLEERAATYVTISTPTSYKERVEILLVLPFDSTRKRMSVIIKTKRGPLLYTKGADTAIMPGLSPELNGQSRRIKSMNEKLSKYSRKGLRTLCFAMRYIPQEEFEQFYQSYRFIMEDASSEREKMLSEKASEIEKDLVILGVTGIEDRLQDRVPETLCKLREAGIQIWVLTGDKLETAENIATASGLFDPNLAVRTVNNEDEVNAAFAFPSRYNLILSSAAIKLIGTSSCKLSDVMKRATCVLCYRMTPAEKAQIVKMVKSELKGNVLAIGDGANDVPMIQASDVGIGIAGKEGLQAAMACDFAIAKFHFLSRLLLVHGHWNYYRLSMSFLYFLYKNANNVYILFLYQFYNGYSGSNIIDPLWGIIYPIIITSVQPVMVGVLDQDYRAEQLEINPKLYEQGRLNKLYTMKVFGICMVDAIFQATVIYYGVHFCITNSSTSYWEFGFQLANAQMFVNSLHLAIEVKYWHPWLVACFSFFLLFHVVYFFTYYNLFGPDQKVIERTASRSGHYNKPFHVNKET